jgi:preprotein translocase subunit SecA
MKKFLSNIKIELSNLETQNDQELELQIEKLKKRSKKENLDNLICPWFATVQEIAYRKIGLKHFDTQLLAGLLLHQGKIVEMKTGEGKTLCSTLPISLNALTKKGIHVVTVNDYLAERDKKWMGKIYKGLNLSVGLVKSTSSNYQKRKSYAADITYVTNSELVFDYLRDSTANHCNELVQRPFNFCVIDEIDSILIDEARTPLILSNFSGETNVPKLYLAKAIAKSLNKENDFEIDEKRRDINLTETGYQNATSRLGKKTLYDPKDPWILEILNALKAEHIFKLNKDYIILNEKICIVDEFTGRIMEDRRWSMGIHEAIEIKEKVSIGGGTKTKSSITYQNFFTLYPKLAGMTGTAKTTEKEFQDIYNLEVVVVPTSKPMIREDLPDQVYQTELAKWKSVLEQSKECYSKGQPLLIGTATVEKSEFLSELFKISKIPHQILNAKPENVKRESEIIAQAGERFAITIATNMAGRGTDIILGGNPYFKVKQELCEILLENKESNKKLEDFKEKVYVEYGNTLNQLEKDIQKLPYSLDEICLSLKEMYNYLYKEIYNQWEKENKDIKELGGLFVLGTERHETRRIDNQLRGRSGRQGDPGKSKFCLSLEDDLFKVFGGDSIKNWIGVLLDDKDAALESNILTKSLENAQQKIELYNYDLRKNVFQYDDALNNQRKQIFKIRNELLKNNIYQDLFLRYAESLFDLDFPKKSEYQIDLLENSFGMYSNYLKTKENLENKDFYKEIWISNDLRQAESNIYQEGFLKNTRSLAILTIMDYYWTEHIERMGYIRETISWRSYGQQNPLVEYNLEAFKSFKCMLEEIRACMLYYFLNDSLY